MAWLAFLNPRGRARRRTYWIVSIVGSLVLLTATGLLIEERFAENLPVLGLAFAAVLSALVFIMATSIRRLHDRNRSGWWMVPYALLPGLFGPNADGSGPLFPMLPGVASASLMLLSIGVSLWAFVDLAVLKGTKGANRFGADPKGGVAAEVFD